MCNYQQDTVTITFVH